MAMYENEQDRINEREVCDAFNFWMNSLPGIGNNGQGFTFEEIPSIKGECDVDFSMWWNHLCVGMIEVKCREKDYDSFLISRQKMVKLWKYKQNGVPGIILYKTPEGIWCQDIRLLTLKKDQWEKAPDHMTDKPDHGKGKRAPQPHFLIPKKLFRRIQ